MLGLGLVQSAAIGLLALFLTGTAAGVEGYRLGSRVAASAFNAAQIAAIADASAKARVQQLAADRISTNIGLSFGGEQLRITGLTVTQIEKVPVYVTAKDDAACVLPDGFVLLHDAAAAGRDPG